MPVQFPDFRLVQALKLAQSGLAVLPLFQPKGDGCSCGRPGCSHAGKHPRTRNGVHDATTDLDTIAEWWDRWKHANIGVATGEKSGLFVLDVDGEQGKKTLIRIAEERPLPSLESQVKTGRGLHYYFRLPDFKVPNKPLGPGLDVRGDGGYVVAPGSVHSSGIVYRHAVPYRPSRSNILRSADVPAWLEAILETGGSVAALVPSAIKADAPTAYVAAAMSDELARLRRAPDYTRNITLNLCAFRLGQLIEHGLHPGDAAEQMLRVARQIGLEDAEANATITSGLTAGRASTRTVKTAPTPTVVKANIPSDPFAKELAAFGETDADNAQRLARRFADQLLCTPGKGYLVYDGQRWRRDGYLKRMGHAEATARAIANEGAYLGDPRDASTRSRFSGASLSRSALDRMLEIARHRLMREDDKFDVDPLLLNVENGTIDLKTGKLRPHRPDDFMTKLALVDYDPAATCPRFERLLAHAFGDDQELAAFVQKAVGYSLSGAMGEQVFFFAHGPRGTSKSTLINAIRDLLGDYGIHSPTETFTAKQYDNQIPTDLARLQGARMTTAIEVNYTRQMDEARVKGLTGEDPIAARFMRQDFFTFKPTCKLWFVANDFPGVRGTAEAFWARVRLIPFENVVAEGDRDPDLPAKLKAEWPGILAWAVRGCLAWQREGLTPPEAVRRGTAGWLQKADHLPRFINDEVNLSEGNLVAASDMMHRYQRWCARHGETALDTKKFKAALEGRDFTHKRTNSGSNWVGVKLRLDN